MSNEPKWADVPGWPGYRVSDDGIVQSCRNSRGILTGLWTTLSPSETEDGYWRVSLFCDGRRANVNVNTLVLICHGERRPPGKSMALHENGDPKDNRLKNLRWGFDDDNTEDRDRHGRTAAGESHGRSKLSWESVRKIRAMAKDGVSQTAISKSFGIARSHIGEIILRKKWKNDPAEVST